VGDWCETKDGSLHRIGGVRGGKIRLASPSGRHDLERILANYEDDFEMSSPIITTLVGERSNAASNTGGAVQGRTQRRVARVCLLRPAGSASRSEACRYDRRRSVYRGGKLLKNVT
jgi:hypothetical protein